MIAMPAICDTCDTIFPSGFFTGNGRRHFIGCTSGPCPTCNGMGHVPDGSYSIMEDTIEILSAPERSISELMRFSEILNAAQSQNLSVEQVVQEIQSTTPSLSPLLSFMRKEDFRFWLTTMISILSLVVTISNSNNSTEQDSSDSQPQIEIEQVINHIYQINDIDTENLISLNQNSIENTVIKPPPIRTEKFQRNDPCYCGSGVKFKRCHGKN